MVHLDLKKVGYTYLHCAVDGFWRLAYTEALADEKAVTTIGFFCRARAFFAAHGNTRLHRVVTDNGANYKARDFTQCVEALARRHQRIRPYTPRQNGKVGAVQSAVGLRCPLRLPLRQRTRPPGGDRGVGQPLQSSSAAYRLW